MTHYSSAIGICLARMVFLFACLRSGSLAWPQDADPPTPVAEFRFIDDGRLITVPVTFASDSYLFTVDSGSGRPKGSGLFDLSTAHGSDFQRA